MCGWTRGQNKLGEDEPRDDEPTGDEAQAVDRSKEPERRDEGPHLEAAPHGARGLGPSPTRARSSGVALLHHDPDEADHARDRERRPEDDAGDGEGLYRIAGEQEKDDSRRSRERAECEQLLDQLSSTFDRGSIRSGSATCSPPAAIGACANVSIALEARDNARSVSSNFFVAFSR